MSDAAAFVLFSALLLAAVAVGEGLRAFAGWRPESSRRAVHVGVGTVTALCPPLFSGPGPIYALAVLFVVVNAVAVRRQLFRGMHGIARESWGTVIFPLALIVALAVCWTLDASRVFVLQTAFLVLALADPAASFVGTRVGRPGRYGVAGQTKSVAGSLAFVGVAAVAAGGMLGWRAPASWGAFEVAAGAVTVAVLGAAAEALGRRGWDNLWIVLAAIVPLVALHRQPSAAGLHLLALGAAVAFGALAYRARFLDLSGTFAASLLAWMLIALGGWAWSVPALVFFVLSSLLSTLGRRRKAAAEALAEKGSRRDVGQVAANGGVAAALLAAHVFWPHPALYWGFVGAFTAAAADTWGTEIGTLVGGPTRRLAVGPRVPPGTSGGVSLPGTLGAVLGAAGVVASALLVVEPGAAVVGGARVSTAGLVGLVGLLVGSGVAAAFLDTALGATLQARFRAPDGTLTERCEAGGAPLPLAAGWRSVDNDRVNLVCTLVGALLPLAVLWGHR